MSPKKDKERAESHLGKSGFRVATAILPMLMAALWTSAGLAQPPGIDDLESRLGLADLTSYRAALAGKATADGAGASVPPRPVSFRDLWDHPEAWSGQRVQVDGRVVRVFRQGAVGSFPPLVEAWLATPAGDLFCVEFPWEESPERKDEAFEPVRPVRFTGTFLKTVRYAAGDQARLAPLIVGDRPPAPLEKVSAAEPTAASAFRAMGGSRGTGQEADRSLDAWSPTAWGLALVLGLTAALVLAWRHLHGKTPARKSGPRRSSSNGVLADPPLEFVETEPMNGPVHSDARSD